MATRFVAPLPPRVSSHPLPEPTVTVRKDALPPPPVHPARSRTPSASITGGASNAADIIPSLPLPRRNSSGMSVEPARPGDATSVAIPQASDSMSDEELRRMFDDDEVERFLRLFATHVTEVTLPASFSSARKTPSRKVTIVGLDLIEALNSSVLPSTDNEDSRADDRSQDGDWFEINTKASPHSAVAAQSANETFNPARMAASIIGPMLPPTLHCQSTPFTLASLRLACQRIYMVAYPTYIPVAVFLWDLASWKIPLRSALFCSGYFILWWYNMLLPALLLRILYTLFHRRLIQYPTAKELRSRRRRAAEAEALGAAFEKSSKNWISAAAASAPSGLDFSVVDLWRLFRGVSENKKEKAKAKAAEILLATVENDKVSPEELSKLEKKAIQQAKEDLKTREVEEDWKRAAVGAIDDIANLHERVKNIFLWRQPEASWKYGVVFIALFLVVTLLPAQILAKGIYLTLGVLFWFVPPVILALSPDERSRLPRPFCDVPTDADYAIEIIAMRTARGERVVPINKKKDKPASGGRDDTGSPQITMTADPFSSTISLTGSVSDTSDTASFMSSETAASKDDKWDRGRWNRILTKGVVWTDQSLRIIQGGATSDKTSLRAGLVNLTSAEQSDISTYPAQQKTTPGLISLGPTTLTFTPVGTADRQVFELSRVRGVKKSGRLGGLSIRYQDGEVDGDDEIPEFAREIKFSWVSKRDELFAKLVGWGARRWIKV